MKSLNNFPLVLCTFLGLNFTFIANKKSVQKYKIVTKTRIIQLQMIYILFETFLVSATLTFTKRYFRIRVALILQFIQVVFPQFIKLFVVYQAFKQRTAQQHIQSQMILLINQLLCLIELDLLFHQDILRKKPNLKFWEEPLGYCRK